MALVTFASLTLATLSQLDTNFNALGALTPIPCTVAGTNTLTLSPAANTPTVAAYANYMQFTGVVAVTNTGAVTAAVGGLPALNVYKDTSSGPVALNAGDMPVGTSFTLMYDSTLNIGAGGFHINSTVVGGSFLPLSGGTLSGALIGTSIGLSGALTAASATVTGVLKGASVTATGNIGGATIAVTKLTGTNAILSGNVQGGTLQVPSTGVSVTRILATTATLNFGSIAAQTSADQTVTLSGASIGDMAWAGIPTGTLSAGLVCAAFVSATNIVTIRVQNSTTISTLSPPTGVYTAGVMGIT